MPEIVGSELFTGGTTAVCVEVAVPVFAGVLLSLAVSRTRIVSPAAEAVTVYFCAA